MSPLDDFKKAGLPVTWRTLLVGWDGPGKHPPVLTLDDIRKYATERPVEAGSRGEIIAIAVAADDEGEQVKAKLAKLAADERSTIGDELRKWQIVLLARLLTEIPSDPLYGALAVTAFWAQFDFPSDGPHEVQSPGATEYYTERNYEYLVGKHRAWLDEQLARYRYLANGQSFERET
jgi:hypothetical protein